MTLKERRLENKLRQIDVAGFLEVVQTAVCKWESGDNEPLDKYKRKLAKLYKCTEADIAASWNESKAKKERKRNAE